MRRSSRVFIAPVCALFVGFAPAVSAQSTHVVVAGDSLWDLSERYLGDPLRWRELCAANRTVLSRCSLLEPGMELRVPGEGGAEPVTAAMAPEEEAPEETPEETAAAEPEEAPAEEMAEEMAEEPAQEMAEEMAEEPAQEMAEEMAEEPATEPGPNLAKGADQPGVAAAGWFEGGTQNGMELILVDRGTTAEGLPFVEYRVAGQRTANFFARFYDPNRSNASVPAGGAMTASAQIEVVANTGSSRPNVALALTEYGAAGVLGSTIARPDANGSVVATLPAEGDGSGIMNLNILLVDMQDGPVVDFVFRIAGLKLELGTEATGYVDP